MANPLFGGTNVQGSRGAASSRSSTRLVSIIGDQSLQNELLRSFIEGNAELVCSIAGSLLKGPCPGADGDRLVLFDCAGMSRESLESMLDSGFTRALSGDYLVLFNVSYNMGIERSALNRGVRGFLYKDDGADVLLKMIQAVYSGELWVSRRVMTECILANGTRNISTKKPLPMLTPREVEVLLMLGCGHSNDTIADKCCISPHTVKTHIYRIFKKIKVSSRLQAAHWASRHL